MRGTVLGYDAARGEGMISGDDGKRYTVRRSDLGAGVAALRPSQNVDFEIKEGRPAGVFPVSPSSGGVGGASGEKSKIAAGLLALFLGGLGIHKFYLGYTTAGVVMLLIWVFGWILLGLPTLVINIIALIEAIIYFVKSDDDFYHTYVASRRPWF
ncbi:MAG: NINE protein [Pseudomonadota bacterium]|nr:NINE protein [Pseudomonadota bacterium]